jgi:superfamily II DNA helicase RecQ
MSAHDKLESLESWQSGVVKIMVCTTAFGMGIDQPDVEIVTRIGCPPTLECMVQEFGRAGRDGRFAKGRGDDQASRKCVQQPYPLRSNLSLSPMINQAVCIHEYVAYICRYLTV